MEDKLKKFIFLFLALIAISIMFISCNSEQSYTVAEGEEKQDQDETIQATPEKEINKELSDFDNSFSNNLFETNRYEGLRLETKELRDSIEYNSFPRLVCLGDSVTFGWNLAYEESFPYLLENKLKEQYPEIMVINSGVGSETVVDGLNRLDSDVFYFDPQVVIINFGLNDAFVFKYGNKDTDLKNNIDLDTYTDTYRQLIERILEKDIEILIMSTNPVIAEKLWQNKDIVRKLEDSYRIYNQAASDMA